ncbi:chitobiosyldiphosphodolichol beta-mannosyltransferase [Toxorhynchites rutilus septentrionalis]|uniref:chitobiosyldiphosphodolichol beta-mannosyltransferase n=1 Tax=Toxorhynchites rutilus septentrionalis TaxID=329112 RepID=UPI002478EF52|nr:chitobiosyldiphosphodolichol beta-mannosyltransferase [Toxorhynchites rutilus septentrionalis]
MKNPNRKIENACVIVLGDIGRSPRMQYHVKSLSETRFFVDVIGYVESKPLDELTCNPNVRIHPLYLFPEFNLPRLLKYIFKTIWQALSLIIALMSIKKPQFILCQNPPAIPTLIVCYMYCFLFRSTMIVDWHNYTHTILAINTAPGHPIVKITKSIESYFGRKAADNFCVTKAMQRDLLNNWNIRANVLYDRPPTQFHPITIAQKHELFLKLSSTIKEFSGDDSNGHLEDDTQEITAFTAKTTSGEIKYIPDRPALVLSSTSWTEDEDFEILIHALDLYEQEAVNDAKHYPKLICVITGKGPLKEHYGRIIELKSWTKVKVITPWLENTDYPKILAAGDLGVCLHYSSSGLDLPMKVVDMFGCGLPVCAMDFNCINELVQHGQNGYVFKTHKELSELLCSWMYRFPSNPALINQKGIIERNLKEFQQLRWSENWKKEVEPVLERL